VPARSFRPDIEGLRAVAVGLVVAYHADVAAVPAGYVGVDVFFVISGFLITGLLAREMGEKGRISLAGFYARRASRILPAATVVIVATIVASSYLMNPIAARNVASDGFVASFFGFNYRLAAEGSNYLTALLPASPLQHYWSLSVEEQFYALWPAMLLGASLLWWRHRRRASVTAVMVVLGTIAVVSFTVAVAQSTSSPSWDYYSLLSRAWELAAGGLVALGAPCLDRLPPWLSPATGWLGLGGIMASAFVFSDATPFPGWAALVPVGGAVLVIVGGAGAKPPKAGPELLLAHHRSRQQDGCRTPFTFGTTRSSYLPPWRSVTPFALWTRYWQ
jgi:peptidoglycan/LPS O-acetylase OafA/YrhL